jgi:hypothetical protein
MEQVEDIQEDLIADEVEDADDFEVFTVKALIAEDEIFKEIIVEGELEGEASPSSIDCTKRGTFQGIVNKLMIFLLIIFSANLRYTDEIFRRRFQMNRLLFLHIMDGLSNWSSYFTQRVDAVGRKSLCRFRSVRSLL